jgi:hypothetical protein
MSVFGRCHVLANATNLRPYEAGSWEPREVDRLAMNVDGWDNPEEHLRRALSVPRTPRIQPGTQYADSNLKVAIGWSRMGWIIF